MRVFYALAIVSLAACVPNGPPSKNDAGASRVGSEPNKPKGPSPFSPPSGHALSSTARPLSTPPSIPLGREFEDQFERVTLGSNWRATSNDWRIEEGRLCGKGARNHPVWLARTLPVNVRIEFDAVSESPEGDLKAEFFGDGESAATSTSYTNATSYLTILGGWKNSFHVLARINEHAPDRLEIKVDPQADEERERPVVPGQVYHFKVERQGGKSLSWWIGDTLMFKFVDADPLSGPGHDHFGFNDWEVPVCFDNVKVVPL